jgi:isopenicillin N synthase-like dioxygenase
MNISSQLQKASASSTWTYKAQPKERNDFFSLPVEEKTKFDFAAKKIYFGYKGIGKEVVDGKGTRDKNELYNVTQSLRHPQY